MCNNEPIKTKVWLLLGVSFVVVSLFMGLLNWMNARHFNTSTSNATETRISDYLGKYFLYNVNVLTTHGKKKSFDIYATISKRIFKHSL